ncbi:MAG: hypothetical protein MOGMAGMI_00974 [Candidatus Omnitrophica bacterium]|nr:hypothetical protein [Candidatus Omnitrophota bacterium]
MDIKHHNKRFNNRGFTLIEILIVVIIIAVLAGLAVPMFQGTVERSRRAEAIQNLSATRASMLRYFAQNNTYVGATFANIDFNPNTGGGGQTAHFTYALGGLAAATFTVTATRNAVNGGDGTSTVTINQAGVVGGTGVFA